MSLNVYKDTATVVSNHGRVIQFRRAGANWQLKGIGETPYQLDSVGGRYRLFDPMNEYTYLFGALGVLERIEDGKGNSIVLTYSFGQLRQVSDGIGRTLTFTYNLSGFLASVSDGTRSVTFTQDANRNLASVTGVMGGTNTYTYQVGAIAGLLLYETYPRGNVHYRQQYDASGRVISQTDAIGGVRRLTYVVGSTTIIDPYGNAIVHHYDAANNLTGFDDEAHRSVSCGLDASGVRNTLTDRLGGVTMLGHRGVFLD
jgi:YD repeat-containing protein